MYNHWVVALFCPFVCNLSEANFQQVGSMLVTGQKFTSDRSRASTVSGGFSGVSGSRWNTLVLPWYVACVKTLLSPLPFSTLNRTFAPH